LTPARTRSAGTWPTSTRWSCHRPRSAGKLHHIGIGRTHARTHIIALIADLDIRVVNAVTGELLRHLTLNPDIDYQPQNTKNP